MVNQEIKTKKIIEIQFDMALNYHFVDEVSNENFFQI